MNRSRPLSLCRSLSDSGFEATGQESDLAYYNTRMQIGQNAHAVVMRNRLKPGQRALDPDHLFVCREGNSLTRESKACMMDHGLGVLDMFLDSMSRELEVPLATNNGEYYNSCSVQGQSYDSLTSAKSIVEYADIDKVDNTAAKSIFRKSDSSFSEGADNVMLNPPSYEDLTVDDVRHLNDNVQGLHKKFDLLLIKMNNLLQQKPSTDVSTENQLQTKKKSDSEHPITDKKNIGLGTKQDIGKQIFSKDSVYVQIEQIYYNLQKINYVQDPTKSFARKFPPFSAMKPAPKQRAVATQTSTEATTEITSLKAQSDRLERENAWLREELNKRLRSVKKVPPTPAPRQCKELRGACVGGDSQAKVPILESHYTPIVGPPTTPPKCLPVLKDIRMTEVTYEWTIPDYNRQFLDQQSGRVHKTISAPFYLTHNGYRARMEAYLNGDGCVKGSFLSVFLRILPSEIDDQLPWPAHLKISLILVNQTNKPDEENKSIKMAVEHCFPRPSSSSSSSHGDGGGKDCWGVLNLASHEKIRTQQFIRKDKLLLQCRVHILSSWKQNKKLSP